MLLLINNCITHIIVSKISDDKINKKIATKRSVLISVFRRCASLFLIGIPLLRTEPNWPVVIRSLLSLNPLINKNK